MPHRAVFITLSHYCQKCYCRHNNYCDTEAIIIIRLFDSNSVNISSCIKPNVTVNNVLNEIEDDVKRLTKKDYVIIAAVTNDVDFYMNNQSCIASHMEEKVKELVNINFTVTALPYRYDEPFLNNKIKRINKQKERFCSTYIHINYLSLNNINQHDYTNNG